MQTLDLDRNLTLGEAVKVTGYSAGRFRYQKARLITAGATVTENRWVIPVRVLNQLGWLDPAAPVAPIEDTPLAQAERRIAELEAELAALRSERDARPRLFRRRS